jgi:hypothetical protein
MMICSYLAVLYRFAGLNELDDSAMESSYGQIEREEKRR